MAGGPVALTREMNRRLPRPVTYQAVRKWVLAGRLPRTEWTGETNYAAAISEVVGGQVSREQLMASGREDARACNLLAEAKAA